MIFIAVAFREGFAGVIAPVPPLWAVLGTLVPLASVCVLVDAWMRIAWRSLARTGDVDIVIRADSVLRKSQFAIAIIHVVGVLGLGWLDAVRGAIGNLVLVDQAAAVLPALLAGALGWWSHAPIGLAAREAGLIGALERGEPVYPLMSRGQYAWLQVRLGYGFVVTPMALVLGWTDAAEWAQARAAPAPGTWESWAWDAGIPLGVLAMLVITPGIMTWVWPTAVLGAGPTRDALTEVCRRQRVRIRRILVWRTNGGLATATLFGVLPRLRYVLFGDVILDVLGTRMLVAVMAHEVAHVQKRHLPWMMAMAATAFVITGLAVQASGLSGPWEAALVLAILGASVRVIAWACRRFEWQADATAAVYLTRSAPGAEAATVVSEEAAGVMHGTLGAVAELNGIDPRRWGLWHGSIRERQRRLAGIVDQRIDRLAIDRAVRRIKAATAAILVAGIAAGALFGGVL